MNRTLSTVLLSAAAIPAAADAAIVRVEITGVVEWNMYTTGPLAPARAGDPVRLSFEVDSEVFVNSPQWPTRGYPIIQSSWQMTAGAATLGLRSPMPGGTVPYFVMRNNDPAVDGFLVSAGVDYPFAVPVEIPNMGLEFLRTFSTSTMWDSLDIMDALGSYGFEFMSSYNWTVGRGEAYFFGVEYQTITLTSDELPCPADYNQDGGVDGGDVEAFYMDWEAGNAAADVNGDGGVDGGDVQTFFTAWENGGC
ncbi:MAG: hypothetical protein JNK25_15435 [Phycisphaerae bacterium]|nr:hypothetical protein [Phycisphaerae bacterium]